MEHTKKIPGVVHFFWIILLHDRYDIFRGFCHEKFQKNTKIPQLCGPILAYEIFSTAQNDSKYIKHFLITIQKNYVISIKVSSGVEKSGENFMFNNPKKKDVKKVSFTFENKSNSHNFPRFHPFVGNI